MATIKERYSTAVHSKALTVDPKTTMSDTDVLSAMGWAGKYLERGRNAHGEPIKPAPLAVPLERLFAGDNNAAHEVVRVLGEAVYAESWHIRVKISRGQAADMARACLAWHRDGRCKPCGGLGQVVISGTRTLGDSCPSCHGAGKIALEANFRQEWRDLARWAVAEMDRAAGRAGPEAMRALAPKMEL